MKKIMLLATGGTIASVQSDRGLVPEMCADEILRRIPRGAEAVELAGRDIFSLDSSNIQPEEWSILADAVIDALKTADGVIVTHGTDTMAYTAAALSFMLQGISGPVVMTGSQLPLGHPLSDAPLNLAEALLASQVAPPGVYVSFHHKIIRGTRAVKLRTTSFDTFDSVNAPLAGIVDADGVRMKDAGFYSAPGPVTSTKIDSRVFLLKLMPGTAPEVFTWIASAGYRGLVLEAFGLGGLHYIRRNLLDGLDKLSQRGIITLVTTQCLYEQANFNIYEVGRNVLSDWVFSGRDMTAEAAVAKMMWVLGDSGKRKQFLNENLCGEMLSLPM